VPWGPPFVPLLRCLFPVFAPPLSLPPAHRASLTLLGGPFGFSPNTSIGPPPPPLRRFCPSPVVGGDCSRPGIPFAVAPLRLPARHCRDFGFVPQCPPGLSSPPGYGGPPHPPCRGPFPRKASETAPPEALVPHGHEFSTRAAGPLTNPASPFPGPRPRWAPSPPRIPSNPTKANWPPPANPAPGSLLRRPRPECDKPPGVGDRWRSAGSPPPHRPAWVLGAPGGKSSRPPRDPAAAVPQNALPPNPPKGPRPVSKGRRTLSPQPLKPGAPPGIFGSRLSPPGSRPL